MDAMKTNMTRHTCSQIVHLRKAVRPAGAPFVTQLRCGAHTHTSAPAAFSRLPRTIPAHQKQVQRRDKSHQPSLALFPQWTKYKKFYSNHCELCHSACAPRGQQPATAICRARSSNFHKHRHFQSGYKASCSCCAAAPSNPHCGWRTMQVLACRCCRAHHPSCHRRRVFRRLESVRVHLQGGLL